MKYRKSIILLATALTLTIFLVAAVQAKPLRGEMALNLMAPGPEHPVYGAPVWSGTITGDINGDMYFYNWGIVKDVGQAHFFWETWLITDGNGNMLTGIDKGVVTWKNDRYRMNGVVTDASGDWAYLVGHNVHMSGDITWQNIGTPEEPVMIPANAPGDFRVN